MLPFSIFRVKGHSMEPELRPGDFLLVKKWGEPEPGEVVVVAHPKTREPVVKRFIKRKGEGLWLEGDNPEHSTDSRHMGPLPRGLLVGRMWKKLG